MSGGVPIGAINRGWSVLAAHLCVWLLVWASVLPGPASSTFKGDPKRVMIPHSFGRDFRPWGDYATTIREELDHRSLLDIEDRNYVPIIRDPRILVLDDALASVDTHTEDKILGHLREVMGGRTTIFISHRVSSVRNAGRIAVLHSGRIVELGTHEELLSRDGYYTELYNKQLLEEELAEV